MRVRGLRFSDSCLEVLANEAASEGALSVLETWQHFVRAQTLRVLGIGLDARGSTKSFPAPERVLRMLQTVGASALYGSGTGHVASRA